MCWILVVGVVAVVVGSTVAREVLATLKNVNWLVSSMSGNVVMQQANKSNSSDAFEQSQSIRTDLVVLICQHIDHSTYNGTINRFNRFILLISSLFKF